MFKCRRPEPAPGFGALTAQPCRQLWSKKKSHSSSSIPEIITGGRKNQASSQWSSLASSSRPSSSSCCCSWPQRSEVRWAWRRRVRACRRATSSGDPACAGPTAPTSAGPRASRTASAGAYAAAASAPRTAVSELAGCRPCVPGARCMMAGPCIWLAH